MTYIAVKPRSSIEVLQKEIEDVTAAIANRRSLIADLNANSVENAANALKYEADIVAFEDLKAGLESDLSVLEGKKP